MDSNMIVSLIILAYGAFLGYCLGRYHGYRTAKSDYNI